MFIFQKYFVFCFLTAAKITICQGTEKGDFVVRLLRLLHLHFVGKPHRMHKIARSVQDRGETAWRWLTRQDMGHKLT